MHGYEAGAEDAGSGELPAEAEAVQIGVLRPGRQDEAGNRAGRPGVAVSLETIGHEEDCGCGLCRALVAVDG